MGLTLLCMSKLVGLVLSVLSISHSDKFEEKGANLNPFEFSLIPSTLSGNLQAQHVEDRICHTSGMLLRGEHSMGKRAFDLSAGNKIWNRAGTINIILKP